MPIVFDARRSNGCPGKKSEEVWQRSRGTTEILVIIATSSTSRSGRNPESHGVWLYVLQVWAGRLSRHRKAVLLLNRGPTRSASITAAWPDVGIRRGVTVEARDVWKVRQLNARERLVDDQPPAISSSVPSAHRSEPSSLSCGSNSCELMVYDDSFTCMQHKTLPGRFTGSLTAEVGQHSCKLFVLTPVPR